MAHYQEVDYCSEEVRSVASPAGLGRRGGVQHQQHVVKQEKFEEVDKVSRTGGHGRHHGRGSAGHFEARETKLEEDINSRTGEFHERKENFAVRAD